MVLLHQPKSGVVMPRPQSVIRHGAVVGGGLNFDHSYLGGAGGDEVFATEPGYEYLLAG